MFSCCAIRQQIIERLTSVVVGGRILGIGVEDHFKFDDGAVHDSRVHTDKRIVFERAGMQETGMPDGDVIADVRRPGFAGDMDQKDGNTA